jgi:hypothetical protein
MKYPHLDKDELWKRGIIERHGPQHNKTDCEDDYVYIHVPTGTGMRFHGSFYFDWYAKAVHDWIMQFPLKPKMTPDQVRAAYEFPVLEVETHKRSY